MEDEIHNVQAVIDSLSMDVLHEDLSHLTGEAICGAYLNQNRNKENMSGSSEPDLVSIEYLLDILRCIHEWISSRLESTTEHTLSHNKSDVHQQANECEKTLIEEQQESKPSSHEFNRLETNKLLHLIDEFEAESSVKELDLDEDDQDLFKSYMKQKEEEYQRNKHLNSHLSLSSINKAPKSSSGNSSASTASSRSSSSNEDQLNVEIQVTNKKHLSPSRRRVTFENSHTKSSKSLKHSTIQTVNNELDLMRQSLNEHLTDEQTRIKYLLKSVYDEDLKDAESLMKQSLNKIKNKSNLTHELYQTAFLNQKEDDSRPCSSRSGAKSKGFLYPTNRNLVNYPAAASRQIKKPRSSSVNSFKSNPSGEFVSRFTIGEDGILNSLLHEFPYLYTSPETIHYLWQKHAKQIETFAKLQKEIEQSYLKKPPPTANQTNCDLLLSASLSSLSTVKSKPQQHLQETYRKQQMLMEIMRKDLQHMQRMEDLKRKVEVENSMKAKAREQRCQNAKVKRYYDEFRLQQRAKMLKKSTEEELVFKNLFHESMKIQKERMLELKRYAKEKAELSDRQQLNEIVSIENFYKTRFELLNERLQADKQATQVRDKAQHGILNKMKSQVKHKLEADIRDLQSQMCQDKDHIYWREMDAKRIQAEIYKANYTKF